MEMEAYIYNDQKGEDISIVPIPDDMKEEAENYHTELIEKICELDDDLMEQYLEENESVDITMNNFMNQSKLRDLGLGSTAGSDIEAILSEFSCFDEIGSMNPAEAKALIDEKLTYMYD